MSLLDWIVITLYIIGLVGLSIFWGRKQKNQEDYFVGGRSIPWWALGISCMATQSSAISFIGIPAFVALKQNGGLSWLQFELAVPLAMILVMSCLIPFFRQLKLVSIYEYLEQRFNRRTRDLISLIFLISRGVGTAAGVYATAIVLTVCLGTPFWLTIVIIGAVTIVYDIIGGMKAVVYSDVLQMVVLMIGLGVCIYYALDLVGGVDAAVASLPAERWQALRFETGLGDGSQAPFWAFLIGGFFLYGSYYGVDQSQAQRGLCAPTLDDSRRALMLNGLARFPLTLLYLGLGIAAGAAYVHSPDLQAAVPPDKPDYLIPQLILLLIPEGIRAVLFAALLAAAMSSLDSSINSLSAVTMRDFIDRDSNYSPEQSLKVSRFITGLWGIFVTFVALYMENISETIIETVNKIGSASYGPVLAVFLLGALSKRVEALGVIFGAIAGVVFNLILWQWAADQVHWMWWNLFGFLVTVASAYFLSAFQSDPEEAVTNKYTLAGAGLLRPEKEWLIAYGVLVFYFIIIVTIGFTVAIFAN